ncbi:MAG: hypothetical protein K2Q20_00780 [Phycisphaerales bacterium]|nr:hypothetical protein [Phycisphaerales bacterium]
MTYRGVYRDGVIVLSGEVELREGDIVEVTPSKSSRTRKAKPASKGTTKDVPKPQDVKRSSKKHPLPGFGGWKHRTDIGDTAEYVSKLRGRVSRGDASR